MSSIHLLDLSLRHKGLLIGSLVVLGLFYLLYVRPNYVSSIRHVPGPPSRNPISGNLPEIFKAEAATLHSKWVEQYGPVIKYRGFLGDNRLYVTDPKALQHILVNKSYDYPKPYQTRVQMARILGKGILFAEGEDHKRQRRVMNQAFTWTQVNSYLPIFQEQAHKLRDRIDRILANPTTEGAEVRGDYTVLDVCGWLSRCTLDVIGLSGFSYAFNQMENSGENELANVFRDLLQPRSITVSLIVISVLSQYVPILAKIPTKSGKAMQRSMDVMQCEGRKMLDIRRKQAEAGDLEDKTDLLSLIVKANMRALDKKDKLLDEEVMGQISTFLLAGHETSSLTVTWILLYMAQLPEIQGKLRTEIQQALARAEREGRSDLDAQELNTLPYLDAVVRETMRCAPPVHLTIREAAHDDVIPISEPVTGRNGKSISSIVVKKGQVILIGIATMNLSKTIFGDDADQYRPERWIEQDLESRVKGFTAWAPLLSFLGGPRGCIGYRFALLEVKVILAALIGAFEFLERDEGGTPMTKKSSLVTRPIVIGEEDKGAQLPLRVRRAPR